MSFTILEDYPMSRVLVLLLALASCLWIGCGQKSKTVTGPDGSKATVTQKGDGTEVTVTGPEGETIRVAGSENGVALPEGFPDDVSIYPAAKVTTSAKSQATVNESPVLQNTTTVVLTTTDPAKKVLDFYGEKLKANGWNIETTVNSGDGGMVMATKDKRTCSAYIGRSGEQTTITLGVTAAK
jgi:hypothetical protein